MNKLFKFSLFMILFFCLTSKAMALNVSLAWDANTEPDLAGYKVYHRIDPNAPYQLLASPGNVTSYTATNLTNDVNHEFVVTAFDEFGLESDYSNAVRIIWIRTVTSQNNGLYSIGSQIDMNFHFSEPVSTQGEGGLSVTLNSGQTLAIPGFTNVQDVSLCYTITEGDNTDHLDVVSIVIDPNTILTSADGTQPVCDLTIYSNLASNSNIRIDTEKPVPPRSLRIPCK